MPTSKPHRPLTAAYLENLHDQWVSSFWPQEPVAEHTCIDLNLLFSAPQTPFVTCSNEELIPDIIDKAARLFMHTTGGHLFRDGNKRTGVLAVHQFLTLNGIFLFLQTDGMTRLAERTAQFRERGIPFDEMCSEASAAFRTSEPFSEFRLANPSIYRWLLRARKRIADHPLMRPDAIPAQAAFNGHSLGR